MKTLLEKLNYKGQERIAIINAIDSFRISLSDALKDVKIDTEIDPRFPYGFVLIFVTSVSEVESLTPKAIHNLLVDGILWFCYPRKTSKNYRTDIDRDHGWKALNDSGLFGIRMVRIDEDWSALRFRNVKFIKSAKGQTPC
jgi:hypothetical protein